MTTHRHAVLPPPLRGLSPAATTILPPPPDDTTSPEFEEEEVPTEREIALESFEPVHSTIRTLLSPPPPAENSVTPVTVTESPAPLESVPPLVPPVSTSRLKLG